MPKSNPNVPMPGTASRNPKPYDVYKSVGLKSVALNQTLPASKNSRPSYNFV